MSRLMHRTCDTALAARDSVLREAEERLHRLTAQLEAETAHSRHLQALLTQAGESSLELRLAYQADRELHVADMEAAAAQEAALRKEIDTLQCRINDLEEEDTSRKAELETRRRRAAETALGGAWYRPWFENSPERAQVAQALLALPLASYDVTVTYQRDGNGDWYWAIDGDPINPYRYSHSSGTSSEEVLASRYGFTDSELSQIRRNAETAYRHLQALTSEEF